MSWFVLWGAVSWGQISVGAVSDTKAETTPAGKLYLQLQNVGLDKTRVFQVRGAAIDRGPLHISLDDGTIAFTEDVAGHVTGAFFEGEGEVLVMPPDEVERASLALFTGAAILEEKFITAYFRFDDDTYEELRPLLRPAESAPEFVFQWNETARNLATLDAFRLFLSFTRFLPAGGDMTASPPQAGEKNNRLLHARVQGRDLGAFDVYYDSMGSEQIRVGGFANVKGETFYDLWLAFSTRQHEKAQMASGMEEDPTSEGLRVSSYKLKTEINLPAHLKGEALLQAEVLQGGQRALVFELSRFLQIERVEADGQAVQFVQNPALEGTQLDRRGNDLVALVFPRPLQAGEHMQLRFVYRGDVLSEAGSGLLYVGARGTWYPNRGRTMSNFDLEFQYPEGWTLVATGKRVPTTAGKTTPPGTQSAHWVSERPIPLAGFNLGKYARALSHAGNVPVEIYAASGLERSFSQPAATMLPPPRLSPHGIDPPAGVAQPPAPSPARNAQAVADESARAVDFFARQFGPFPYGSLTISQIPGELSQGWPGLIYLSGLAFLTPEEKGRLNMSPVQETRTRQLMAHEAAHQWWGDLINWRSYHDQWLMEALSEYSSLMLLESESPNSFRELMDQYREDLLKKNKDGSPLMDAGPVTLGIRLSSSRFPLGYEGISYERGAWLFHILRSMMRDGERAPGPPAKAGATEPFIRALRKILDRYAGKSITTAEFLRVCEEELPPSLWYEGHKSLAWFYQGWINGTAIPRLELHGVKYADSASSTVISGTILQKDAPNDLVTSVPVYATAGGKNVLIGRVFADGAETGFRLKAAAGARKAVLDPNHTVLARIQ